ncbi:FtsX-like permease family protein [Chitinophaga sp. GCM10012297]|uniref:ABC transporter permease n=1 Tax=Chitinophaga chungangae TaxID=2821488 RepID=A0ABS3YDP6_9BACT|nr:FtsX-like permease family protein [Chitinophaga chungangae]MBO9152590.1 ABC transporter permease [Chitinophaga chungangae]
MIWQFALRYFRARKSTSAINIIAWVSVGAIAVGTAALITVLSVFNGFTGLVKSLYSSFYPTLKVVPATGKTILFTPEQIKAVSQARGVANLSASIEEKAVLRYEKNQTIAVLKGIDSAFSHVAGVENKIIRGSYDISHELGYQAVIGLGIESALGVDVEHSSVPVNVYMPKRDEAVFNPAMPEQAVNSGVIYPAGTFAIQQEFDSKYVLTDINFLRSLLDMQPGEVTSLEIAVLPGFSETKTKRAIQELLGDKVKVQTRMEQNATIYNVMQTEKWVVYVFLSFILVIAAFNMIGSLSMLVIEKQKDITILKAMGGRNKLIQRIFLTEGLIIAGAGSAIGFTLAITICLLQQHFGLIKLGGGSFLIDAFPVEMHYEDFILVIVTILVIGVLASWYPAQKAARQEITLKAT